MNRARTVLFRSSVFSRLITFVLAGALALVAVVVISGASHVGGAAASWSTVGVWVIVAFLLANFRTLVVTFDGAEIMFRFGLFKKRMPLSEVVAAAPYEIKWWRFGGAGIRPGRGGWGWITGSGPGVKIETTKRTYYASCLEPARLVSLLEDFARATGGP